MSKNDYLVSNACFSDDGLYRYFLARVWDAQLPVLAFIMLNPSTADGETDDSTVKRCVSYAKQWGYGGIEIYNLYAFRATKPRELAQAKYPVGENNNKWLHELGMKHNRIIVAWGGHAKKARVKEVMAIIGRPVECVKRNKDGSPHHPLHLAKDIQPVEWR